MKIRNIKSVKELRKTWNFCKGMGITEVVDVPIRKKGMTGSGLSRECHSNARLLTKTYGGKVVLGFAATTNGTTLTLPNEIPVCDESIFFLHHSVWETPEGEMVDVTWNDRSVNRFWFLPLIKYDPKMENYSTPPNVIFTRNDGVWLYENRGTRNQNFTAQLPNKVMKRTRKEMRGRILEEAGIIFDDEETGGFTEPSTATGKLFELREVA